MSVVLWIASIVTLALFAYLFVALFHPESFD